MLVTITEYQELDARKLMDIYSESNYENTDYFFPDEPNKDVAVRKAEDGFLEYLKNDFFRAGRSILLDLGERRRLGQCITAQQDYKRPALSRST